MSTLGLQPSAGPQASPHGRLWSAAASLALSLWAGIQIGSVHPDEVFQFLEPANRLAFGYGWKSWEWVDGIRNWAVPGALAGGMKLIDLLGWTSPWGHRFGASLAVAVLSYPGISALQRYAARRFQASEPSSRSIAALWVVVLWGPCFLFLGRTLGESMGGLFGMAAIEALDRPGRRRRDAALAGLWLGLAVVVRYPFAALIVGVMLQLGLQRRWRDLWLLCLAGAPVALALGALDWATWGEPFHSMIAYVRFNLGDLAADRFGREPWWFFFRVCGWLPWPLLLGLPWLDLRRARSLIPSLVYLAALVTTPHKEGRFLFPIVLWTTADLAPAFVAAIAELWHSGRNARRLARFGVLLYAVGGAGAYLVMAHLNASLFRAMIEVGKDPGLTGLLISGDVNQWGTGGDTFLGRPLSASFGVPGEESFAIALRQPIINRAIVFEEVDRRPLEEAGFKVVDQTLFGWMIIMAR